MRRPMPKEAIPELFPEQGSSTLKTLGLFGIRPFVLIVITGGFKMPSLKDCNL